MSLLSLLGITDAVADTAAVTTAATGAHASPGMLATVGYLVVFAAIFYFLLIRPQTKRAKDHRKLVEGLAKDDEIVTTGGIAGKIVRIVDNYVVVSVAENVELTFQKGSVALVLPKGTLKSIV